MSIKQKIGIIAEYNPFHNGHLYQIEMIKKQFDVDLIVAVISGDYVQRGEISSIDKWQKTGIILQNGVDLVVELPLYFSIQNAEVFSSQSVKILEYLEIDMQIFGAEEENIIRLESIVNIQETDNYQLSVKEYIKLGNDYNKAQLLTLNDYELSDVMKSNNILGLEYIRARIKNKFNINQEIIKREKVEYNELQEVENISSATYIRTLMENGEYRKIKKLVPKETYESVISNFNKMPNKELIFQLFKYKFLTSKKQSILNIYDMDKDIYNRISKYLINANKSEDFFTNIESRNYSKRRMHRVLMNTLLNIENDVLDQFTKAENQYVRILGFNEKGQQHIKKLQRNGKNIFVNWKDIEKSKKGEINKEAIKIEKNGFLIKEILLNKKEQLNPIVIK